MSQVAATKNAIRQDNPVLQLIGKVVLYIVLIAVISIFITRMTTRTILFMLAALFAIGLVKDVFLPEKKRRAR